jgi:catechol 2,3-dioxygenase-like lactoylglutathione lyase family enzyme
MQLVAPIPILRSLDAAKARAFYCEFLGFSEDWAHRFEADFPLYLQMSRAGCVLHLSEHPGDCCPGAALRISVEDLDGLHAELSTRAYGNARPGIISQPWGRAMQVTDPFGNRLIFTDIRAA